MKKERIEVLRGGGDIRGVLSGIRQELREGASADGLLEPEVLRRCRELLRHEDAKTRKNAALLLGDLAAGLSRESEEAKENCAALFLAWQAERTRFVEASYVKAMAGYDVTPFLDELRACSRCLEEEDISEEDKKHVRALQAALRDLLGEDDDRAPRRFSMPEGRHGVLLTSPAFIRPALLEAVRRRHTDARATEHGVYFLTDDPESLSEIRLFSELLFRVRFRGGSGEQPMAQRLLSSELFPLLRQCLGEQPFYTFRIVTDGASVMADKHKQVKDLAYSLEEASERRLRSAKAADAELLFFGTPEGRDVVFARFAARTDERFSYRKDALPTSMTPVFAAQVAELLRPYFKEGAALIDPFCGVGTLLIERNRLIPAGKTYGVDIYREAVEAARKNAERAGCGFYFIQRDYFDFTAEFLLDEVLTEFPRMESRPREETDRFYRSFFEKTSEIAKTDALLFLLSTEERILKKQIRLHAEFQMLRQIPLRGREQIYIVKKRG